MTPFHRATMLGLASLGLLALAACTTTSPNYGYGNQGSSYPSQTRCADCGIVTRIDVLASTRSAPAATGTVLGGVVVAPRASELIYPITIAVTQRLTVDQLAARNPRTICSGDAPRGGASNWNRTGGIAGELHVGSGRGGFGACTILPSDGQAAGIDASPFGQGQLQILVHGHFGSGPHGFLRGHAPA